MEKVNLNAEVNAKQEDPTRKTWQTPVAEELPMVQTENTLNFGGGDNGIYTSS